MGCNIHIYTEGKKTIDGVEKWVSSDFFKLNPYYDGIDKHEEQYNIVEAYDGRNYRLFAVLAGVRNFTGIEPISEPRGLPHDCCETIKSSKEYWGVDGHSHSYLTLAELEAYAEKKVKTKYSGYVHESEVDKPLRGENPSSWCQGTNQPGHVYMEWEVEENILGEIISGLKSRAKEVLNYWNDEHIAENADKLRIVFWFDN